jgi:thiol reductant ABC exporter CydC subunit
MNTVTSASLSLPRRLLQPHVRKLVLAALSSAAASVSAALLLATSFALLAWAAARPPVLHLLVAIVAVRAFALLRAVGRYGERLVGHDAALGVVDDARRWSWRKLAGHPSVLTGRRSGDMLRSIVGDLDDIQESLVAAVVPIAGAGLAAGVVVGASVVAGAATAGVLAAGLVAAGGLLAWSARVGSGDAGEELVTARTDVVAQLVDGLAARDELLSLGAVTQTTDRFGHPVRQAVDGEVHDARRESVLTAASGVVAVVTTVAVLAVSSAGDGRLTAAAVGLALAGFEIVAPVPIATRRLGHALAATRRLVRLAESRPSPSVAVAPDGVLVALDGVAVLGDTVRLDDVTLTVPAGARIAVVGPSGSGKTTLAHVLCGLLPVDGLATAGGVEPRDLVALVPQSPHLFAGTVRDNLRIARDGLDDLDLVAALERVGLGEWVAAMPAGLDTAFGEAGAGVSTGQGRRLATARALLADRSVLILDEPTADLDAITARSLLDDLLVATEDRAVVLVTHDDPDRGMDVYEMDAGRLTRVARRPTVGAGPR